MPSSSGTGATRRPELLGDEARPSTRPAPSPPRVFGEAHGEQPGRHQRRPQVAVEAERLGGAHPLGRATPSRTRAAKALAEVVLLGRQRDVVAAQDLALHLQNATLNSQRDVRRSHRWTRPGLAKISADSHIDEPHDLWFERLDADLRDRAPRRIQAEQDGGWSLVIDDSPLGWSDLSAEEAPANESARVAAAAPDVRFEMMRTDGVNAEIIYPTIGLYAWNITDPDGRTRVRASSTTTGSSSGSAASSASGSRR